MSVMNVRVVGMRVHEWRVIVRVSVRLFTLPREIVSVLVVRVVRMRVLVRESFVRVRVDVPFGQMQPDTQPHQRAREQQCG